MVPSSRATVRSVNIVFADRPDGSTGRATAIDKSPVGGPVSVTSLGLAGDRQIDPVHHGGPTRALYAVSAAELAWWSVELGRDLTDGAFGENLTIAGMDVDGALVGEQWLIGDTADPDHVVVEVTAPRIPCSTFARWLDEPKWVIQFTERGNPGAYLSVAKEGRVAPGASVSVLVAPDGSRTIREVFAAQMNRA
jgi:MOSC domain-containing protein YiiM